MRTNSRLTRRGLVTALLAAVVSLTWSATHGQSEPLLHERYSALQDRLANSTFQRPLIIESRMASGSIHGDVYAVIAHPFPLLSRALQGAGYWCDIMMLHLNVKNCLVGRPAQDASGATGIRVALGRKYDQALEETYQIDFDYRVPLSRPDYFTVQLTAENGPLDTHHYKMAVEAIAINEKSSFIHMTYSYAYGASAQLAMDIYLATIARNKVGFSRLNPQSDSSPIYIGGTLGGVERNTMRYYLAIEAFLAAFELPIDAQPEARLRDWFAAIERYPRQLHELTREQYLRMKRAELIRQRAATAAN